MNGRGIDRNIFPQRNVVMHGRCWDYASEDSQYLVLLRHEPQAIKPWILYAVRDGYPTQIGDFGTPDALSTETAEEIARQQNRLKPQGLP